MTFKTTEQNKFRKDPLRGLEYKHIDHKPYPFVQISFIILIIMAVIVLVKIKTKSNDQTTDQIEQVANID